MSGPGVFALPHLSEDAVAAFADGVLSPPATERARRHCAECYECADAVRGQRETAMMLRTARAPALPSGLLDRLAGLPMSAPLPPPSGGLPTMLGEDGVPVFVAYRPPQRSARQDDRPAHRVADSARVPGSEVRPSTSPQHPAASGETAGHGGFGLRRRILPVSMLASAAAVVAAGTFGGQLEHTPAAPVHVAPAAVANATIRPVSDNTTTPTPVAPSQTVAAGAPLAATLRQTGPGMLLEPGRGGH